MAGRNTVVSQCKMITKRNDVAVKSGQGRRALPLDYGQHGMEKYRTTVLVACSYDKRPHINANPVTHHPERIPYWRRPTDLRFDRVVTTVVQNLVQWVPPSSHQPSNQTHYLDHHPHTVSQADGRRAAVVRKHTRDSNVQHRMTETLDVGVH